MKHKILPIILLIIMLVPGTLAARNHYGYTEDHPLVIAADWDFQPFEFLNTDGQPSGYNIEVLDLILTQLEIPHKFVMQEWHTVNQIFARHEADLIHALSFTPGMKNRPDFRSISGRNAGISTFCPGI